MKKFLTLFMIACLAFTSMGQTSKTIKRKVAIGRFSNETQYGKGAFYDKENDPMSKQALDILSSKLATSGKFILLERNDLDVLVQEAGDAMHKIGADYIILGSITEFGRKNEGNQGFFTSTKTQTVEAGVNIRIVEASSGLIIYSGEAKGQAETSSKETLGFGGSAGYDATLSDKAISAAISQLVENIINECTDTPWKSYILDIDEDENYIISGGASQGLAAGDTFSVYSKGKVVKNPQSGMDVELPGKKIGTVTVVMTLPDAKPENEISMCSYEGAELDKNNLLEKYYILND